MFKSKEKGKKYWRKKVTLFLIKKNQTTMKNFFINITKDLELKEDTKGKCNNLEGIYFLEHLNLTQVLKNSKKFDSYWYYFKVLFFSCKDDGKKRFIMNLEGSKATPVGEVHADMLKQTTDIHLPIRLK